LLSHSTRSSSWHFLYIGASDLIPEMHRGERSWSVVVVHLVGVGAIVVLTQLITF